MAFSRRGEPGSSSTFSAETPSHFFMVVLPSTLQDKKLRIPEKFVRKFGDELSTIAKVTVPNGHAWNLELTKDGEKMWFNDGWHDFVNYFSISAGYFLVFRYGKNSEFHVLIFDQTACEIRYPYYRRGPKNDEKNSLHQDEMKIENSAEIMPLTAPNSPSDSLKNKAFHECGRDQPSLGSILGTNRCRKCGASFESASARKRKVRTNEREREEIDAANAFESSNPFCRVVMRPSYLSTMCLPSCFSRKYLNGVSRIINLQLSDGKQWPVRCIYRWYRAKFSQGWRKFRSDNNLREGDVCVFELLRSSTVVLKVTVFRVLESANFVKGSSFGSARGIKRSRKGVGSPENPKFKHGMDMLSKRCKIEELDEIDKSDAAGDGSKLIISKHKVEAHSSDEEKERAKFHVLEVLSLLEDMGISVSRNFRHIAAEERSRATAGARLFKPKHPSFMVILQLHNLKHRRLHVPSTFGNKHLSKDSQCIKVQDSDGLEWPLQLFWNRQFFFKKCTAFYREKNLGEGDVCIFELIRVKEPLLKVSILYASKRVISYC